MEGIMAEANKSKLVAVVFDDPYKAEEARAALHRMGGEGLLEIDETAMVVKYADGSGRVSQDVNVAANGEKVGHLAGLITAAVTGTFPFIIAGTVGGWLVGKLTDHGITNSFIARVKKEVVPGTSALIVLARSDAERRGKVIERMEVFKPTIIESDLPDEVEREITKALEHEQMAPV
jgi:uncharacterized membrane protein